MKKIILTSLLISLIPILSGCKKTTKEKEEGVINPFSPSSMVNTYQGSKEKINDSVQKENNNLNNTLREGGITE